MDERAPERTVEVGRVVVAIVVVALLVAGGQVLIGRVPFVQEPGGSDLTDHDLTVFSSLGSILSRGELGLWDRRLGCGIPTFAEGQSGALFPTHWTVLFLPGPLAYSLTVLLNLGLAGFLTFLLARQLGRSHAAAALAAVTYPLAGYFARHVTGVNLTSSAALFPGDLLLAERAIRSGRVGAFAGLGVCLTFQLLAGHPHVLYCSLWATSLWVALRPPMTARELGFRSRGLVLAFSLAAGLAMIRVIPAAELWQLSPRSARLSGEELAVGAIGPSNLLQLIDPWALGDPSRLTLDFRRMGGTFILFHVGTLGLALALVGLFSPGGGEERRSWLPLLVLALAFAMGPNLGLLDLLGHLPGYTVFRMHGKALFVAELALALAAARGLEVVARRLGPGLAVWLVAIQAAMLVGLRLAAVPTVAHDQLPPRSPTADHLRRAPAGRIESLFRDRQWVRAYVASRGWRGDQTAFLRHLSLLHPNVNGLYDLDSARAHCSTLPSWSATLASLVELTEKAAQGEICRLPPGFSRVLGLQAVRHVLSSLPLAAEGLAPVLDTGETLAPCRIFVYENRRYSPRARVVGGVVPAEGDREALAAILKPGFDPDSEVVIQGRGPTDRSSGPGGEGGGSAARHRPPWTAPAGPGPSRAAIVFEDHRSLVIDSVAQRPGHLVVSDTFYPGWRGWCDGVEVPILRANLAFRAVAVAAGSHRIVMRFEPSSVLWGARITVIFGLVALALMGVELRRSRSAGPGSPGPGRSAPGAEARTP